MSQPTPNKFSLEKLPRPVIYGVPAALLIAGVGAWYFATSLSGPTVPVEPTTIQSTAPTTTSPTTTSPAPAPTAQVTPPASPTPVSVTPPAATPASSPVTSSATPTGTTPPETSTGPSRSLEVQPIPFLVTAAPKTSTKTAGVVAQANPNNRPRVSVNPFAPLNAQPAAPQATPTAQAAAPAPAFNASPQPNVFAPATSNLPPIRPAPSVQVSGTGQPLPSFPTQGNTGNPGNTSSPGNTSRPGTTAQMTTPKSNAVKPVPTAITSAKPQISAPVAAPTRTDVPTPLTAGALPIAPSILREVVPQGPSDVAPNLTPVNPATPEVPANIPVISTPTAPTQPSDLKPSPSDPVTPTPLSSTTSTATPPAPPTPPATVTTPTPTSTPLSSFILSNKVAFVGVIIGPVNTAILETKDGTVIVPLGGTIPQSDVIVKSVTATQVVLMLGQETVTIDRSKK